MGAPVLNTDKTVAQTLTFPVDKGSYEVTSDGVSYSINKFPADKNMATEAVKAFDLIKVSVVTEVRTPK